MKTLRINKGNYSGEKGEIRVLEDGRFFVEGIDGPFRLEERIVAGEKVFDVIDQLGTRYRGFTFVPWSTKTPSVIFEEFGCQRSHSNPICAFALLAWNIF